MGLCRYCSIVRLQLVGTDRFMHVEDVRPIAVVAALSRGLRYDIYMFDHLRMFSYYGGLIGN
jgi:hypothetical protein